MEKIIAGIGELSFPEVLTIVFICLKLCGFIDWPWLWVLSPLWISVSLLLITAAVLFVIKKRII